MEQLPGHATHRLAVTDFDLLASATPAVRLIAPLRRARLSRTVLLIKYVVDHAPDHRPAGALLAAAQDTDPAAVDRLLTDPWVAVWAGRCARQPDAGHLTGLTGLAIAAAGVAGLADRGLMAAPPDGQLVLPTLGVLTMPAPAWTTPAQLTGAGWWPVHRLAARWRHTSLAVTFDDGNPYRDLRGVQVASRLDPATRARYRRCLVAAWRLVATWAPAWAAELACGLTSVVPLRGPVGQAVSASHAEGFGGVAVTATDDPAELAAMLVHELQHSKLSAVESITPLVDQHHRDRYPAPWRPDPRPLGALLHGCYAFTAVAGLWRQLARYQPLRPVALRRAVDTCGQVRRALAGVAGSPGLTAAGRRLVSALDARVDGLAGAVRPGAS